MTLDTPKACPSKCPIPDRYLQHYQHKQCQPIYANGGQDDGHQMMTTECPLKCPIRFDCSKYDDRLTLKKENGGLDGKNAGGKVTG